MKFHQKAQQYICDWLEKERFHLSRPDALLHLALLGLISGFLAGGTIVLFRFIVENIQDSILPGQGAENYEGLTASLRFLLPLLSSLLLALLFYHGSKGIRVLGIAHVIERMALYVVFNEEQAEKNARIYGILTKEMIEKAYKI